MEIPEMVDLNCPANVPQSLLHKTHWSALAIGIIGILAGLEMLFLALGPDLAPLGLAFRLYVAVLGMIFVIAAGSAFREIIWGQDYWVFYARDYKDRPIEQLHVHRDRPVVGTKPIDVTACRFLASTLPGPSDALSAAKLGHKHPDVIEIDGPLFRLRTGWLVRSEIHNCLGLSWEIVGFRITEHTQKLELDIRSTQDYWSRLRLGFDDAVALFGGRRSDPTSTGSDLGIHDLIYNARHNEAAVLVVIETIGLWGCARDRLLEIGRLITTTAERSSLAMNIRDLILETLRDLGRTCSALSDKNLLATQLAALEKSTQDWKEQHGSPAKPPRSRRAVGCTGGGGS